eukprot:gene27363-4665_t
MLSSESTQLACQLGALHPVEALTVMAAVVQGAVEGVHPSGSHALAQALFDLSIFCRREAELADAHALSARKGSKD